MESEECVVSEECVELEEHVESVGLVERVVELVVQEEELLEIVEQPPQSISSHDQVVGAGIEGLQEDKKEDVGERQERTTGSHELQAENEVHG